MFAVVEYYNYRKNLTFEILHVFNDYDLAKKIAFNYAKKQYSNEIVNHVEHECIYLHDSLVTYTSGDGYDKIVYAVIELPEPEEETEDKKMSGGKRKSPKRKSPKRKSPKRKSPKKMSGGKRKSKSPKQSGGLKRRSYYYQRTRQLHGEQGPVIAKCPRGKKMAKNGRCFKKRKSIKPKKN